MQIRNKQLKYIIISFLFFFIIISRRYISLFFRNINMTITTIRTGDTIILCLESINSSLLNLIWVLKNSMVFFSQHQNEGCLSVALYCFPCLFWELSEAWRHSSYQRKDSEIRSRTRFPGTYLHYLKLWLLEEIVNGVISSHCLVKKCKFSVNRVRCFPSSADTLTTI